MTATVTTNPTGIDQMAKVHTSFTQVEVQIKKKNFQNFNKYFRNFSKNKRNLQKITKVSSFLNLSKLFFRHTQQYTNKILVSFSFQM